MISTYDHVVVLAQTGASPIQIATSLNIHVQTVYSKLKMARISGIQFPKPAGSNRIKRRIPMDVETRDLLAPHAASRSMTAIELGQVLLRVIAQNGLVAAVLDDGGEHHGI